MSKVDVKSIIKEYFDKCPSSTARDIYFRIGRICSFTHICDTLDELEKEGYLSRRVVPATKYIKAHYEYSKVPKKFSFKDFVRRLFCR